MKKLLLIGGGGHARVVLDAVKGGRVYRPVGLVDPALTKGIRVGGVPVLGGDEVLPGLYQRGLKACIIAVGGGANPGQRTLLAVRLERMGFTFASVIHPRAVISPRVVLGPGAFVAAGAVINGGARIGSHAIINTGAIVEHDCHIGSFAHIAPGVTLGGSVRVGDQALVGLGSSVRPGLRIGEGATVGVGSAVVADVPAGAVAFGNPCRQVEGKK